MANVDNPFGARIRGAYISANFNTLVHEYIIPATDNTDLFFGDFVKTNNTSEDGVPIVVKANATETVRGIVVGFKSEDPQAVETHRRAGIRKVVYVCDDPLIDFEIQANGILSSTDIGKNANFTTAGGDNATGLSAVELDVASISTNVRQLRIIRILDAPDNSLGANVKIQCLINKHEFNGTIANVIWSRNGTNIVPSNDGDTITGHTASGGDMLLDSTTDATKGSIKIINASIVDNSDAGTLIKSISSVKSVVAATGIDAVTTMYIPVISSTAGDVNITANPQIVAGTDGQELVLIGTDDTRTVTLDSGDGLALDNGLSFTLGENNMIKFVYYNSLWLEQWRIDN